MNPNKTYNILVTGVGAIIGYGIIESLRISGINCAIIGIDIYEVNYGRYICDHFEVAPYTNDPGYYDWLSGVCKKYSIDLIMPGIEQDLYSYNENRALLPTACVLNSKSIIDISTDKYDTWLCLKSVKNINLIPTLTGCDFEMAKKELGLPFIIKPRRSYASKGFHIIKTFENYRAVEAEVNENTLFQSYVGNDDEEYTFSVFGKGNGEILDQMILRRYLSKEGATQKAYVVDKDDQMQLVVDALASFLKPLGPTNFQFRKQGNIAYLLEINPRISSACSLRSKFGYNEPRYCIEHYLQDGNYNPQVKKAGKAIRFISDKIIYE
jgi:carbamoyl-phosphate synthase large subunit